MHLRTALKSGYYGLLSVARVDRIVRSLRTRRHEIAVLNLHSVSPRVSPYWPPLSPEAFDRLAGYLAASCRVLTFDELSGAPADDRLRVVLSFDDGCRDFVEYAMPILARHQLRANHNIIVQSVETGQPPWIIRVMDALGAASPKRVRSLRVPGFTHVLEDDSDRAKVRFGTLLANYLKATPPHQRDQVASDVASLLEETDPAAWTPMMTRNDLGAVSLQHELGGHSYGHESMAHLTDEEFRCDTESCRAFFGAIGQRMRIYAFPNGSARTGQVEWLLATGVEHVLLVGERLGKNVDGVHPRITIYGDSDTELRLRAMGLAPHTLVAGRRG